MSRSRTTRGTRKKGKRPADPREDDIHPRNSKRPRTKPLSKSSPQNQVALTSPSHDSKLKDAPSSQNRSSNSINGTLDNSFADDASDSSDSLQITNGDEFLALHRSKANGGKADTRKPPHFPSRKDPPLATGLRRRRGRTRRHTTAAPKFSRPRRPGDPSNDVADTHDARDQGYEAVAYDTCFGVVSYGSPSR